MKQNDTDPSAPPVPPVDGTEETAPRPATPRVAGLPNVRYDREPVIHGRENDSTDHFFKGLLREIARPAPAPIPRLSDDDIDHEHVISTQEQADARHGSLAPTPMPSARVEPIDAWRPRRRALVLGILVVASLASAIVFAAFAVVKGLEAPRSGALPAATAPAASPAPRLDEVVPPPLVKSAAPVGTGPAPSALPAISGPPHVAPPRPSASAATSKPGPPEMPTVAPAPKPTSASAADLVNAR